MTPPPKYFNFFLPNIQGEIPINQALLLLNHRNRKSALIDASSEAVPTWPGRPRPGGPTPRCAEGTDVRHEGPSGAPEAPPGNRNRNRGRRQGARPSEPQETGGRALPSLRPGRRPAHAYTRPITSCRCLTAGARHAGTCPWQWARCTPGRVSTWARCTSGSASGGLQRGACREARQRRPRCKPGGASRVCRGAGREVRQRRPGSFPEMRPAPSAGLVGRCVRGGPGTLGSASSAGAGHAGKCVGAGAGHAGKRVGGTPGERVAGGPGAAGRSGRAAGW